MLQDDVEQGPGKRWKVSMVAYQRIKDAYNPKNEDYIYLFGGIKVMNSTDLRQLNPEKAMNTTSYSFMDDLWRYDLVANQWETVEVYGISEITRDLFLWNGTRVKMDVATKDRLADDLNNTKVAQQTNETADRLKGLRLPQKRGGHMMTIAGNPPDYIIIFGGTSIEYLLGEDAKQGVDKIKSTINDFWVFNIRNK